MEPTNAVVFRDVSVRRSGLAILEHVNATVPQGSCTVIVGPNGAGKTTLILALIGEMRHDGDIDVMTGRSGKPHEQFRFLLQGKRQQDALHFAAGQIAKPPGSEVFRLDH